MADGSFTPIRERQAWTPDQDAIIREHYPKGGSPACLELMPWRTTAACNVRARKLGVRRVVWDKPALVHLADQHIDDQIRAFYSKPVKRNTLKPFAKSIGRPHWYVKRRAAQLGVIVPCLREPQWSERELEILSDYAGLTPNSIRKKLARFGFKRSVTGIVVKRKRIGLMARDERDMAGYYTATGVANGLGISSATVLRWINLGQLKANRRREDGKDHTEWDVRRHDLQSFLAAYPTAIDLRKIDREWFFHMAFAHALERS